MSNIYIAGIAMTVFGRHPDRSLHHMADEALQGALGDAGCETSDIGVAYYSGMTNGLLQDQISIPGQVIFSKIGIEGIPVFNVENACASGSSGFNLAVQSLKAGTTDVALSLGAEKMNIPDKMKAFAIFEGGWDVSRAEEGLPRTETDVHARTERRQDHRSKRRRQEDEVGPGRLWFDL